jgi:spermidine synthase
VRGDPRFALLLVCFFLSGLAGLIYQTAWTRQLAFVFGTSELAVVTVLAAYMGGLAAGAAAAARFVARIRRPVLVYGLLELGIAAAALGVPAAIAAATALQVAVFGGRADTAETPGLAPAVFTFVCSATILLVPTGLMGATLPLLARHAVRREGEIGPRVGLLYATNTAGAVAGALASGFVLLPLLGLRQTLLAAATANAMVFVAALLMARGAPAARPPARG